MILQSNLIDFDQLGGYRFEQPTLKKMQANAFLFLKAMIGHFGISDLGNFIISGCVIDGANITEGILYIDGVVCPFETTDGTLDTKIKKLETVETIEFFNGTTPPVFKSYTAVVDASGIALSAFIRVPSPFNLPSGIVIDPDYLAFTQAMLDKLNDIEAEAQVNVIPSWTQNNAAAPNYIANKPIGKFLTYLKQGVYIHGDLIGDSQTITISFGDIGTNNYKVMGCIVGSGSSTGGDARVNFVIREPTATSFKLSMHDNANTGGQNIRFEWILVPTDNS